MHNLLQNLSNIDFLIQKHKQILTILNEDENKNEQDAMLVGGCVRDFLQFGILTEDVDISTILTPNDVLQKLKFWRDKQSDDDKKNIFIIDRDSKYGTIVVIIKGQRYEITTTRSDIDCFGRQAEVEFCQDFYTDSQRRDFTINALYVGLNNKILDFHNGIHDLQDAKVIFIGEEKQRIKEDFLRIVRFFRFSTKFNNFNFDKNILNIIEEQKKNLSFISRERIKNELWKLLSYTNWQFGLECFKKYSLFEDIFLISNDTKIEKKKCNFSFLQENINSEYANNILKLLYFFNYDFDAMFKIKETLKFTKLEKDLLEFLHKNWSILKSEIQEHENVDNVISFDMKKLIFYDKRHLFDLILPLFSNEMQEKILLFSQKSKNIKISSSDLIEKGFSGVELGKKIKELEEQEIEKISI